MKVVHPDLGLDDQNSLASAGELLDQLQPPLKKMRPNDDDDDGDEDDDNDLCPEPYIGDLIHESPLHYTETINDCRAGGLCETPTPTAAEQNKLAKTHGQGFPPTSADEL